MSGAEQTHLKNRTECPTAVFREAGVQGLHENDSEPGLEERLFGRLSRQWWWGLKAKGAGGKGFWEGKVTWMEHLDQP